MSTNISLLFFFFFAELYDVPLGLIILLSCFYGSISIIAVIGNSLVIWIVATTRQMQTVTNLFIANLALADVIIGMFAIPFQVINFNLKLQKEKQKLEWNLIKQTNKQTKKRKRLHNYCLVACAVYLV